MEGQDEKHKGEEYLQRSIAARLYYEIEARRKQINAIRAENETEQETFRIMYDKMKQETEMYMKTKQEIELLSKRSNGMPEKKDEPEFIPNIKVFNDKMKEQNW
jgi:hypothetical protein